MPDPSAEFTPTEMSHGGDAADVDRTVDVAVHRFAQDGFAATKLEDIGREAGMSKRMIHYHFGDKRELYRQALIRAAWTFSPPQDFLERSYAVPVEGIRRFVDILYHRMVAHPDSIRLILRENLDPVLTEGEITSIRGEAEVLLQIERLLLMGQDVGAFRPGISATDVVVLIASLGFFRTGNSATLTEFGAINLMTPTNTEGMRRLIIDAVLTFLTSNIPDSGYESYLTSSAPEQAPLDDDTASDNYLLSETLIDDLYETPSGE